MLILWYTDQHEIYLIIQHILYRSQISLDKLKLLISHVDFRGSISQKKAGWPTVRILTILWQFLTRTVLLWIVCLLRIAAGHVNCFQALYILLLLLPCLPTIGLFKHFRDGCIVLWIEEFRHSDGVKESGNSEKLIRKDM